MCLKSTLASLLYILHSTLSTIRIISGYIPGLHMSRRSLVLFFLTITFIAFQLAQLLIVSYIKTNTESMFWWSISSWLPRNPLQLSRLKDKPFRNLFSRLSCQNRWPLSAATLQQPLSPLVQRRWLLSPRPINVDNHIWAIDGVLRAIWLHD